MADALGRSPLASHADALRSFEAAEIAFLRQRSLRVDPSLAPIALPTEPNTWVGEGEREVLWLGPDEWLVVGGSVDELAPALAGIHHSLIDVSANRAVVELRAAERLEHLATGCGLDLDPRAWRAGTCAQTMLARVPVLLQERGDATRVFVRPSLAGYLVTWLAATRRAG